MTRSLSKLALRAAACALAVSGVAQAQLTQPGDTVPLPKPAPMSEIDIARARGWTDPEGAVTLAGLFAARGEMIDPVLDARQAPGAFSPLCGFQGTLLLRGGGCKVPLGWYNVDDPSTIHQLVPDATVDTTMPTSYPLAWGCPAADGEFCPLALPAEREQHMFMPIPFASGAIRGSADYHNGLIGFALMGLQSQQCSQTKYSEASRNGQYIQALIYQSTVNPDAFYIAFEDLPITAQSAAPDSDFNDFVYLIEGVTCQGGGQACDTGLLGACAVGRTDCGETGETTVCRPVTQPAPNDACDNLDNNCNGVVDEDPCPNPAEVCDRGACVPSCASDEFPCGAGLACENGHCVDPACVGVTCEPGFACRGGNCVGACDGVVCPLGQECQLGRCVDLCAGVQCPDGRVCERGLCLASCDCRTCPDGTTCAAVGERRCVETGCENVMCPAGEVCVGGTCTNACTGVVCPGGAACDPATGQCGDPIPGGSTGGATGSGGVVIGPGTGGVVIGSGGGGPGSGGTSGGDPQGAAGTIGASDAGCGCRTVGGRNAGAGLALLFGLGLLGLSCRRTRSAA